MALLLKSERGSLAVALKPANRLGMFGIFIGSIIALFVALMLQTFIASKNNNNSKKKKKSKPRNWNNNGKPPRRISQETKKKMTMKK